MTLFHLILIFLKEKLKVVEDMQKAMMETNDELKDNHFRLDEKLEHLMSNFDKIMVKSILYFSFNIYFCWKRVIPLKMLL